MKEQVQIIVGVDHAEIKGIPGAAKCVRIRGLDARSYADLKLHGRDMDLALKCIDKMQRANDAHVKYALWCTAVVSYGKCFRKMAARKNLVWEHLFKEHPELKAAHREMMDVRDKHFAHDANAMLQAVPCADLAKPGGSKKVLKVSCAVVRRLSPHDREISRYRAVIAAVLEVVEGRAEEIRKRLQERLEGMSYEKLDALDNAVLRLPGPEAVGFTRELVPL